MHAFFTQAASNVRRTLRSAAAPALADWRARGGRDHASVTGAATERRRQLQRIVVQRRRSVHRQELWYSARRRAVAAAPRTTRDVPVALSPQSGPSNP
jgi:hypothetical protein